jgi:hypothetical protein
VQVLPVVPLLELLPHAAMAKPSDSTAIPRFKPVISRPLVVQGHPSPRSASHLETI